MISLINLEANVKLELNFLNHVPVDFNDDESKFEKWIPYTLHMSTPERNVFISQDMHAFMTVYEMEKNYNGIMHLPNTNEKEDKRFTHYNSEGFFEISTMQKIR